MLLGSRLHPRGKVTRKKPKYLRREYREGMEAFFAPGKVSSVISREERERDRATVTLESSLRP